MNLPLSGVRVLDLSRVLAGPSCAMALADFGADVVKVEHPARGDDTRDWGARFDSTRTAYFNSANRNKRSIVLDLNSSGDRAVALALAGESDIVVQNFKAGGAERLGLGYEQIRAARADTIYCSISGYDSAGPEAGRPGYDLVVQGEAGLMAINGEAGQAPLKFGVAVVDLVTGMYAAQAILAALVDRQRTGRGHHVQMALYDCGLMINAYCALEALQLQREPLRYGNAHPSIVPYGVFEAADGPLVITVGNTAQFQRLCIEVLNAPGLATDQRYATNGDRMANREPLLESLHSLFRAFPRSVLLERLRLHMIPCGEVLGLLESLNSPRSVDDGLVQVAGSAGTQSPPILRPPYRLDGERMPVRLQPPVLGAHTSEVLLQWLGSDAASTAVRG